jgi:hypothetical protein
VQIGGRDKIDHRRPVTSIDYRVLGSVEYFGERDWSPTEGRGGAFQVKAQGTPGMTEVVISSNLDQPQIRVKLTGRRHKERAQQLGAEISAYRRADYERRIEAADVADDSSRPSARPEPPAA